VAVAIARGTAPKQHKHGRLAVNTRDWSSARRKAAHAKKKKKRGQNMRRNLFDEYNVGTKKRCQNNARCLLHVSLIHSCKRNYSRIVLFRAYYRSAYFSLVKILALCFIFLHATFK